MKNGVKSENPIFSAPKIDLACWCTPLRSAPTLTRLPRMSATVRMGESFSVMKNIGPAFMGATMRRSMGCSNGGSPRLALPIQFAGM